MPEATAMALLDEINVQVTFYSGSIKALLRHY
jgi:hypothetical protein